MSDPHETAVLGFVAWSGTGKTTLLEALLPLFAGQGLRIGVIKHAHHGFDIDQPGKDSYRLRHAGADRVLVASAERWALMVETPGQSEPALSACLAGLDTRELDLVLAEGFKHERYPKIELHRAVLGRPLMFPDDPSIVAIASDTPVVAPARVAVLDLNRPSDIARYVHDEFLGRRRDGSESPSESQR